MKKLTRPKLVKKLDKVFSQYIRASEMDINGYIECYTCRANKKFTEIQAGHFMSRKSYSTRWDEYNVFPQCVGCNIFKSGMQFEFGRRLDEDFGKGFAEEMQRKSRKIVKISTAELRDMIELYQKKLQEFEL
jgi:hypothetical protein